MNCDFDDEGSAQANPMMEALRKALSAGNPDGVLALLDQGADLGYRRGKGYGALLDAVHGREVFLDARLIELLGILIAHRVELNGIGNYGESGLRVLSRLGRFDAVQRLLEAGADESQLEWTPLIRAVALGTVDDVRRLLDAGVALEDRDWWSRTAWLVALQVGDLDKISLLADRGADQEASGRCGKPPLFFAIQCHRTAVLRWLLGRGVDIERTDEFGATALIEAAETGDEECVELLLGAGAEIDRESNGRTALGHACTRSMAVRLIEAGADPKHLSSEGCRAIVGLPADPDEEMLAGVTEAAFRRASSRRFGTANPEPMDEPFWLGMIRSGVTGYRAAERFGSLSRSGRQPVWCAHRFGQALTCLPDGRTVLIGGEHEDHYDPDFCIYNDVFVHEPDGRIRIFGYPEHVFAPTDFHTATLVDDAIYIIGSVGYWGRREYGRTPIHRLAIGTWRIERLEAGGEGPGWIHGHRAKRLGAFEIGVTGGEILAMEAGKECQLSNPDGFVLDLERLIWRKQSV